MTISGLIIIIGMVGGGVVMVTGGGIGILLAYLGMMVAGYSLFA